MSHAVHYRDAAGNPHLEDRPSLDAALELVEGLQNEAGATEVRVFREVPIEVKTYYRVVAVEAGGDGNGVSAEPVAQVVQPEAAQVEPEAAQVAEPEAAPVAASAAEPAETPAAEPVVAETRRLAPVEPPSGATIMSPPPASIAPLDDAGDDHDAEPRGEHRRQLFSRG